MPPLDVPDELREHWTRGVESIERGGSRVEQGAFVCQTVIQTLSEQGWDPTSIARALSVPVSYVTSTLHVHTALRL